MIHSVGGQKGALGNSVGEIVSDFVYENRLRWGKNTELCWLL